MLGQPGASQVITSDATTQSLPDILCRLGGTPSGSATGCLVEVLTGSVMYLLHDPTIDPVTSGYTLNVGDIIELSAPHFFRHTSAAGATFRATRFESTRETRIIRAAGASGPGGSGLTDTQLRASPVPVSGTVTTGGLTDTQLRAAPVPVSGSVTATGPLTDAQLRAAPVPVSGSVTTGGLTDAQLRAAPVPISGSVTATTGGLTDTELRATPVPVSASVSNFPAIQPVSATALPLPTGAATEATLALLSPDQNLGTLLTELILELRTTRLDLLDALH